jgi:hypothetical protein
MNSYYPDAEVWWIVLKSDGSKVDGPFYSVDPPDAYLKRFEMQRGHGFSDYSREHSPYQLVSQENLYDENPFDEEGLITKLSAIQAMIERATTDGERKAAESARDHMLSRLQEFGVDPKTAMMRAKKQRELASAPRNRYRPPPRPRQPPPSRPRPSRGGPQYARPRPRTGRPPVNDDFDSEEEAPPPRRTTRKSPHSKAKATKAKAKAKPRPRPAAPPRAARSKPSSGDPFAGKKKVKKSDLRVGKKVFFKYRNELMTGKITKLNPKTAVISQTNNMIMYDVGPGTVWNISYTELRV